MSNSQDTPAAAESGGSSDTADHPLDERSYKIVVENEDTGRDVILQVGREQTVQKAIDELYESLGRGRDPRDRLTCAKGGVDVFQFAGEKLEKYVHRCPELKWKFVGPTGGAGAEARSR